MSRETTEEPAHRALEQIERAESRAELYPLASLLAGAAAGGALAVLVAAPMLTMPLLAAGSLLGTGAALVQRERRPGLRARRRALARHTSAARVVARIADAGDGELVTARGRLHVLGPVRDPASGDPVGAYVRWTHRAPHCECWGECAHAPRSLVSTGRCGRVEIRDASGVIRIEPAWAETALPLGWADVSSHGALLLRDGDDVTVTGIVRASGSLASDYRGARGGRELTPGIAGFVVLDHARA